MAYNTFVSKACILPFQNKREQRFAPDKVPAVKTSISKKSKTVSPKGSVSEESYMRMSLETLANEVFYYIFLYQLSLESSTEERKTFLEQLRKDHETIVEISPWGEFHFQLILHLVSLIEKDTTPSTSANFYISPNLCLLWHDENPEPESLAINASIIKRLKGDAYILFMKKLCLGVNPSKPDEERIIWDEPKEALVAWLTASYLTGQLDVSKDKHKHRPDRDRGKYEEMDEDENRPIFPKLIQSHFFEIAANCTICRDYNDIFNYFLCFRGEDGMPSLKNLIRLIEKKSPADFGLSMKRRYDKNEISMEVHPRIKPCAKISICHQLLA